MVADSRTLRPIAGATVGLPGGTTTSGSDGWCRMDLACSPPASFNTSLLRVTAPGYAESSVVVGRGVAGVLRLDMMLERN